MSRAKKNSMHGIHMEKSGSARRKADGGAMGIIGNYQHMPRPGAALGQRFKKGGRARHKMDGGMMNANNNQMPVNNAPNQYSAASQVPRPTQGVQPQSNNPWANPALNGLRSQQPQQPMNQGNNPSWMQNPNLAQQMNMPVGNKYKKGGRTHKKASGGWLSGFQRTNPGAIRSNGFGFRSMFEPSGQAGTLGRQEQFDWDKANSSAAVDREFNKSRMGGWAGLEDPMRDRQQKRDIAKRLGIENEYGSSQRKSYLDSLSGFKDPAVRQKFADMAGPDPMAQQPTPTPGMRRGGRTQRKASGGVAQRMKDVCRY